MHNAPHASLDDVARHFDTLLRTSEVPDYPGAMNGIQVEHEGPVTRCAVAVDASLQTIDGAITACSGVAPSHCAVARSSACVACSRTTSPSTRPTCHSTCTRPSATTR